MITLALIVCILGAVLYLAGDPAWRGGRVVEAGRIMFWTGLAFVLWGANGKALL